MGYISEKIIENKVAEIKNLTDELEQFTSNFTAYVNEIQDLLVGLKVCLNTEGGSERIKEIAAIEFDTVALNNLAEQTKKLMLFIKKLKWTFNHFYLTGNKVY